MLNFQQKNHSFRTIDLLGLIVLVGAVGSISGAIIAQAFHNDKPQRAQAMAEALARQIHADQVDANQSISSQRGPASVHKVQIPMLTSGELGHDPWGRPFHYSVRKAGKARSMTRVFVWSDGANGKSETDSASFEEGAHGSHFVLGGDDVGLVEEFTSDF
jgi:hypothetical protein